MIRKRGSVRRERHKAEKRKISMAELGQKVARDTGKTGARSTYASFEKRQAVNTEAHKPRPKSSAGMKVM